MPQDVDQPYTHQSFPKWIFGPQGDAKLVQNEAELAAFPDYAEAPFDPNDKPADLTSEIELDVSTMQRTELIALAAERGVQIDRRWSAARIREAIGA